MVKIMENPIKMDDLGGKPTIFGHIHFACNIAPNEMLCNYGSAIAHLLIG